MAYRDMGLDAYNKQTWSHRDNPGPGQSKQHFGGYKPGDKDLQRGVGNAMGGQYRLANVLHGMGRQQFNLAGPAYGRALGFYSNLMGSAAGQRQALEPAIRNIRETSRGTQSFLDRNLARSGARDLHKAEAAREAQGDINAMLAGAPLIGAQGTMAGAEGGLSRAIGANQAATSALGSMGALGLGSLEMERQRKREKRGMWGNILGGAVGLAGKLFGF